MADQNAPQMKSTLGLTGLTANAMALIAPGAFLWLTFVIQAGTGTTAPTMWLGIFAALLLCLATAVCLRGNLQALSRHRVELLLRGAGAAFQGQSLQVRPRRQVHCRLGLAPLLLGLSRRDGGRHRRVRRLCSRLPLSQLHERLQSRAGLHGAGGGCSSRSSWHGSHRRARAHPRRSTLPSISSRSPRWWSSASWRSAIAPAIPQARPAQPHSSTTHKRWPPTPTSSPRPRTAPSSAMQPPRRLCPCSTRPASRFLTSSLTRRQTRAETS